MEIKKEWYKNNLPINGENNQAVKVISEFLKGDSKVIGLLGDYGSGKSSIIKALDNSNDKLTFYTISIPNFLEINKDDENAKSIIKCEIRKAISMQLISLFESDSEINSIKKKLYIHTFEKLNIWELAAIASLILLPILKNNSKFILENFNWVENNKKLLFMIISIIFIISIITVICKLGNYIKNIKLSDFNINKINIKQKTPETYIDYDLETIVALIEANEKKVKGKKVNGKKIEGIVIVIEDIDRYDSKEVLQEIIQVINSCKSVKFILPVKSSIFSNPIEQSKYFDAQYTVLPINDKMNLYEYIENTLSEHQEIEISISVLILTSPFIEDFRVFHNIYNMYLSLLDNYLKINKNPDIELRSSIYSIAVLYVFLPNEVKNNGSTKSQFSQFIESAFKKTNIENYIIKDYKKKVDEIEKQKSEVLKRIDSTENEIEKKEKISNDQALKLLNYSLCDVLTKHVNRTVKIDRGSQYVRTIRQNILEGKMYSLEQIDQITDQFNSLQIKKTLEYRDLVDDGKLVNLQSRLKKEKRHLSKLSYEVDSLNKKLDEVRIDIENNSSIELIVKYNLNEYIINNFDKCIDEKNGCRKYKDLICSLILNEYITEEYKKHISILYKDEAAVNLRKFKYDISSEVESYEDINTKELGFEVNQGFIDSFGQYEFSKIKFVNKEIIEYLISNIEVNYNSNKLNNILSGLTTILEMETCFEFNETNEIHKEEQSEKILELFEKMNSKNEISSVREFEASCKILNLYYLGGSNCPENLIINIVKYICTHPTSDKVNDILIWEYTEYNLHLIEDIYFKKLFEIFQSDVFVCIEFIKNIEKYFDKVKKSKFKNKENYFNILVSNNLYEYNEMNIKYLLKNKKLVNDVIINSDKKFVEYICSHRMEEISGEIDVLYKQDLFKSSIRNLNALNEYYLFKILDLNELSVEVASQIVKAKIYSKNKVNAQYFIENRNYRELLENFDVELELVDSKTTAIEILNYLNETSNEEYSIDNFIDNVNYQYSIIQLENRYLQNKLIEKNRVEYNISNYRYIKDNLEDTLLTYLLNVGYKNLVQFDMETEEYDDILSFLYERGNYEYVDNLYKHIEDSKFSVFSENLNINTNILILQNNELNIEEVTGVLKDFKPRALNLFKDKLINVDVELYLKYCTPRIGDVEKLVDYINKDYNSNDKIKLLIEMKKSKVITSFKELKNLMIRFQIYEEFEFKIQGRGRRLEKEITTEIEDNILNEFCAILKEFKYLSDFTLSNRIIYRNNSKNGLE